MEYIIRYRKLTEFRETGDSTTFHYETDDADFYDAESVGEAATKFYMDHDDENVYKLISIIPHTKWLLSLQKNLDSTANRASKLDEELWKMHKKSKTARRLQIASFVLSIVSLVLVLATIVIQFVV